MLPKEEKIKKKKSDSDQPGLFDKEDEKKRLRKKRIFIYISMFFTIGLSLSFWTYRSLKNFSFNFNFKLPQFNFSMPSSKSTLNLSLNPNSNWSLYLENSNSQTIVYEKNSELIFTTESLETLSQKIDQSNFITSSKYASSLPEGVKVKEIIDEQGNSFSYFSKIITPNQELLLVIGISNSTDLETAKKQLPQIIDQLYWYSLQK